MKDFMYWIRANQENIKNGVAGTMAAIMTILFFCSSTAAIIISVICFLIITIFRGWEN